MMGFLDVSFLYKEVERMYEYCNLEFIVCLLCIIVYILSLLICKYVIVNNLIIKIICLFLLIF